MINFNLKLCLFRIITYVPTFISPGYECKLSGLTDAKCFPSFLSDYVSQENSKSKKVVRRHIQASNATILFQFCPIFSVEEKNLNFNIFLQPSMIFGCMMK